MDITNYIFEYLKTNGKVIVQGFGTFYLRNTKAKIDVEHKSILPPAKEIAFNIDYKNQDSGLINFMVEKEKVEPLLVKQELEKLTNYWKNILDKSSNLVIESLGSFQTQNEELIFIGKRIDIETPDFYGLEEIDVQKLKRGRKLSTRGYSISWAVLWIFIILLIGLGIAFYFYPQYFWGKDSILNLPEIKLSEYLNSLK